MNDALLPAMGVAIHNSYFFVLNQILNTNCFLQPSFLPPSQGDPPPWWIHMLDHFQSLYYTAAIDKPQYHHVSSFYSILYTYIYFFRFRERADAPQHILDASAFPSSMTHCASNRSHCGHFLTFLLSCRTSCSLDNIVYIHLHTHASV